MIPAIFLTVGCEACFIYTTSRYDSAMPSDLRTQTDHAPEFAPEYTLGQRIRRLVLVGVPSLALAVFLKFWLFPWLKTWLGEHPCGEILGWDIQVFTLYALFGIPALLGLAGAIVLLRDALRILRSGQVPPPGAKVWQRTPIRRGTLARRAGYGRLAMFVASLLCVTYCLVLAVNLVDSLVRENPTRCVLPLKNTI